MAKAQIETGEERLWRLLLTTAGIFAVVFLVLEISDYLSDRGHAAMQKNDLTAAATSIAVLAIVGVIAGGRAMKKKQTASQFVAAKPVRVKPAKKKKKPGAAYARRKRRA